MAKIIQFPGKQSSKLGYTKAKRKRRDISEKNGQLNLFSNKDPQIFSIPSRYTPFEEAYILDEKHDPRAREAYFKAIESDDYPADAFCNLGIIETENGNTSKAFNFFSNALKIDERHFESHYNLANLYFDMDDLNLAQIHYEIAIEIQPDFPNSYFNLGLLYSIKKRI